MSKICPVINETVLYATCLECDEKECMKPQVDKEDENANKEKEEEK